MPWLPCELLRIAAADAAKQLGLAIMQYAEDNDETLPPAANFHDAVSPYVQNQACFMVANHPFLYMPPANLAEAKIDAPSETPIGRIDLDCGSVILYADGHVRAGNNPPDRK